MQTRTQYGLWRRTRNVKQLAVMLGTACFITNLSQLPALLDSSTVKGVVFSTWLLVALRSVTVARGTGRSIAAGMMILLIASFDVYILTAQILSGGGYITANLTYPVHVAAFVALCGYVSGQLLRDASEDELLEALRIIGVCFVSSALLVGLVIYLEFFVGTDWYSLNGFLYGPKNSFGLILVEAIAVAMLGQFPGTWKIRVMAITPLVVLLLMLRSRAAIIGLAAMFVYVIVSHTAPAVARRLASLVLVTTIAVVATNGSIFEAVVVRGFFQGATGSSLDTLSSGRIGQYQVFFDMFPRYVLFGSGGTYIESFPLTAILSFGLVGSLPVLLLALVPLIYCAKPRLGRGLSILRAMVLFIWIVSIVNSFFEELAPFGPGAKFYFLWLLTGFWLALTQERGLLR
jgi:hypothetical protein